MDTKYKCDVCNFTTNKKQYLTRHTQGKKHIMNVDIYNKNKGIDNNKDIGEDHPKINKDDINTHNIMNEIQKLQKSFPDINFFNETINSLTKETNTKHTYKEVNNIINRNYVVYCTIDKMDTSFLNALKKSDITSRELKYIDKYGIVAGYKNIIRNRCKPSVSITPKPVLLGVSCRNESNNLLEDDDYLATLDNGIVKSGFPSDIVPNLAPENETIEEKRARFGLPPDFPEELIDTMEDGLPEDVIEHITNIVINNIKNTMFSGLPPESSADTDIPDENYNNYIRHRTKLQNYWNQYRTKHIKPSKSMINTKHRWKYTNRTDRASNPYYISGI